MPASRRKHGNYFVYKFCGKYQQILYVGQHVTDNENPITRINQHIKNNKELYGETTKIYYFKCPSYDYMCNLEGLIINLHAPKFNKEFPEYAFDFAPGKIEWTEFILSEKTIGEPEIIAKEWFNQFEDFLNGKIDNSFVRSINSKKGRNIIYKKAYEELKKMLSIKYFGIKSVNCNIEVDGRLSFLFFPDDLTYKIYYEDILNMDKNTYYKFSSYINESLKTANKIQDIISEYYNKNFLHNDNGKILANSEISN